MRLINRVNRGSLWVRSLLVVLAAIFSITSMIGQAGAASGGASGLSISPLRQELTLTPGQTSQFSLSLKNITSSTITAKAVVRDFESDNVTGNPKIITDPNTKSPASIRSFISGLSDINLTTGQQKTININVAIPTNASPGAYYGLIEYQAVPSNPGGATSNNKVALTAAVSQLVFITVPGNIVDRMEVNDIHVYQDKQGTGGEGIFFTSPPKSVGIELANIGNGFEQPFGHVALQNFGGKAIYSYELNGTITRGIVLPNSSRIFINPLSNISHPGRYTIVASVSYGSGSAILTAKKSFWYIPPWLIITIVVVLVLLIIAAIMARRRYKRASRSHFRR